MNEAERIGDSHRARKRLFAKGLRRHYLTIEEIESDLPPGAITDAERWLLYYSLQAMEIEIRGDPDRAGEGPLDGHG